MKCNGYRMGRQPPLENMTGWELVVVLGIFAILATSGGYVAVKTVVFLIKNVL
mgnify:CR=1 FL=1